MTPEQELILRVVKADAALPSYENYEEFITRSPEHKEWADAIEALRQYAKTLES